MVLGAAACVAIGASAQSSILLEACNSIVDSSKRLVCLQELMNSRPAASSQPDASGERVRNAFLGLQGTVSSGISYSLYTQQLIEPASALGVYRASPKADPAAVEMLELALQAYGDAQTLWRASIYDSKDAGLRGRIFPYRELGLVDLVEKYQLPVISMVYVNDHLPIDAALPLVWRQASDLTKAALQQLERPGSQPEGPRSLATQIYLRTGLRLDGSMKILHADKEFANSEFPAGGVLESIGGVPLSSLAQLMTMINAMKKGGAGYDVAVRYYGMTLPLFLKIK